MSAHIRLDARESRVEDRLLDVEAYLAAIVESSDDGIIGKDMSGTIKSWNRAAQAIFGYEACEVVGRPIQILFPPDRLEEEDRIMARLRRGERVEHLETVRRRKDGSDIAVSLTISPIRDRSGMIIGASKILRDITDRQNAQKALAMSAGEFRASFESAAVGKVLADPTTRIILRVNDAFARMIGSQPDDLIGRSMTQFVADEDRAIDGAHYASLLGGTVSAQRLELRLVRVDGAPLWVRISASLALSPDEGAPYLAVIGVEDIDARHRAEASLLETQRRLEAVVEERTRALVERDILLREVYHRVKNNLQIVDAMLVFGEQKIQDSYGQQVLADIRIRIHALALVHHQLMGSSDLKTFDVAPFIRELCGNITGSAADDRVRLTVRADPLDVGLDFAVPLGLVVAELVTNALKHAFPDGGGDILVDLRRTAGERIVLTVSDDGIGQPSDHRANAKVGLGWRIVHSLVSQLRGVLHSRHENGTTIEISLPTPEAL